MAVYLIDKKFADLALDLAYKDESAKIVLIQDGVYLDMSNFAGRKKIFYVGKDMDIRGITAIPEGAKKITYLELIDLIQKETVFNFM